MSFQELAIRYLSELLILAQQARVTGQFTQELSYRPALDRFFRALSTSVNENVSIIFEPKSQNGLGRPDWLFYNAESLGVYGYIDSKGLDFENPLNIETHDPQMRRYLSTGHRVILTDGIDFAFYSPEDGSVSVIGLVSKPIIPGRVADLPVNPLAENLFRSFLQEEYTRTISEQQLVKDMAIRARYIADKVIELSDLPVGAGADETEAKTISALSDLKQIIQSHHDPLLQDPKHFADFVAQVLIFGLLYAHRTRLLENETPQEKKGKLEGFWKGLGNQNQPDSLSPFQAVFDLLAGELESLGSLGTWFQDSLLLLSFITVENARDDVPDYHELFEAFLQAYDPKIRFDFGAFYTPKPLAEFMVRLVKKIIEDEFPGVSLFSPQNRIIDPGCGTGTFLEQLFMHRSVEDDIPYITGFEILPGPYALAKYRISAITRDFPQNEKIHVVLANTLSDELESFEEVADHPDSFQSELYLARELAALPLTLVIGNPPSSDSSTHSQGDGFEIIDDLLNDFRPPPEERRGRQNIQKQISNEFMKFLRWATNKLTQSKPGFLAFVLPSSFAEHPSYRFARQWISENFCKAWIIDLDLDGRSGVRASSIFNTLQGRLLLVAFTGYPDSPTGFDSFQYFSIAELRRTDKLDWLGNPENLAVYENYFSETKLTADTFSFRPTPVYDQNLYNRFWSLYQSGIAPREETEPVIFERHCSGVKLAPSSFFIHYSNAVTLRKLRDIADQRLTPADVINRWFRGQRRPPSLAKFNVNVRNQVGNEIRGLSPNQLSRYSYRPLLNLFAFISEPVLNVLGRYGGGGTRYRPELISAFQRSETKAIALSPAPKDISENLHRFASFCWFLPDNDLTRRGNAQILANYYPEYKERGLRWDSTPRLNINSELIDRLSQEYETVITSDEVLFFVYAILCSDDFLDTFEGALFTVSDESMRPRIPIPRDRGNFLEISSVGRKLADLEREPSDVDQNNLSNRFGEFRGLFSHPFGLTNWSIDEETETIKLYSGDRVEMELGPIPIEILEFQVSGYSVIKEWLKMRSLDYSRTEFTFDQFVEFIFLLERIDSQLGLIANLNNLVIDLVSNGALLIEPTP